MAYKGLVGNIQLGQGGMMTDDAPSNIPATNLIKCRNCIIDDGAVENEPGSIRWNKTPLYYNVNGTPTLDGSGVVAVEEWFPVQDIQYVIVVTRIGKVYRFINQYSYIEITANQNFKDSNLETSPNFLAITDSVNVVRCGQEESGLPRKMLIFTGGSQVQVISGTNTTRTNISNPPTDWKAGNYPIAGILFMNRVFAWGNSNFPHNVYGSDNTVGAGANGNEDFVSDPFNVNVSNIFPGESQKVVAAFNYKGRLQVAKYPRGLYYLNLPNQADPTTWYYSKLSDDLGTTAPRALCNVYDDYWMMTNDNSIVSMSAALTLGQLTIADVMKESKVSGFFKNIISPLGIGTRQALFHSQNKKAYFLTRKTSFDVAQRSSVFEATTPFLNENVNSMFIIFDFSSNTQKIMYSDKDQANCMALIKNNIGIDELYIGSEDGYIYKLNQENRAIKYDPPQGQISLGIPSGSGNVPNGTYSYGITNLVGSEESVIGAISKDLFSNPVPTNSSGLFSSGTTIALCIITNHTVNGTIQLSNIPLSTNPNVNGRNIYRSINGGPFFFLHQIADNTTTTYLDNNASVGMQTPPNVGTDEINIAYTSEFQTPHLDFTQTDIMTQSIRRADKNFDFLELECLPSGASNVSADVYIDGAYTQTQSFYLGKAPQLDSVTLDNFRLQGDSVRSQRLPIFGRGRTISVRVYASVLERIFNITAIRVYFRMSGTNEKQ